MFWNKKWGQFWGHTAFLAQAALKVANLSIFFSKTSFCGDGSVQKERFGQVKILLDSPGVLTLHCQRLSAFLWDKCLTSSLVRFSSQFVQSVHINICSASQAVNRDVSAWGLHGRCQRARYPSHATFTGLWPRFRLRCSWGIFGVSPEQNSSGPWQGVQDWNPVVKNKTLSQLPCRLVQTVCRVHHHFLQNRCRIWRFR